MFFSCSGSACRRYMRLDLLRKPTIYAQELNSVRMHKNYIHALSRNIKYLTIDGRSVFTDGFL